MTVLVAEDNLMWSARFTQGLRGLGHESLLMERMGEIPEGVQVAIVNLGSRAMDPAALVDALREKGVYVIAHAGHKEKELHELGRTLGCDRLATNSEITHKLPQLLEEASGRL